MGTLTVVGQGLAGTLAGLAAEAAGRDFVVVDQGSGVTASRAAAGLFNPLTGPRFTAPSKDWDRVVPFYRDLEQRLGRKILHPLPLLRPLDGTFVNPETFPRSGPGWSARVEQGPRGRAVRIDGGGWLDIPALLDETRRRWLSAGKLEDRRYGASEGVGRTVLWCGGFKTLVEGPWAPSVEGRWQPVRGDVLTVELQRPDGGAAEIGSRFLLPAGDGLYRWGATHESDIADLSFRPGARKELEDDLERRWGPDSYRVVSHAWGIRPASRNHQPLVEAHPNHPEWTLFNGFGGRGVVQVPLALSRIGLSLP